MRGHDRLINRSSPCTSQHNCRGLHVRFTCYAAYHIPLRAGPDTRSGGDAGSSCGRLSLCVQPVPAIGHRRVPAKDQRSNDSCAMVRVRSDQCLQCLEAKRGRKGRRVGFPRYKRKGRCRESFRLRNKAGSSGAWLIRVGEGHPRSVTLPKIGTVRVHDDTRRLRRLLRPVSQDDAGTGKLVVAPRARILFATCRRHGARWYISLNIQAPDFHPQRRHPCRPADDHGGFVGVDRGLSAFAVAATAARTEVGRFPAPKPLQRSMLRLRTRSRAASRTQPRSSNHAKAVRRLSRACPHRYHAPELPARCLQPARQDPRSALPGGRTSPSPTCSATESSPAPSVTPLGPSWRGNSATKRFGTALNWSSVTAGCHPPGPARSVGGSHLQ